MILVTGAAGYLGAHVCARLRAEGIAHTPTTRQDCDLMDGPAVAALLQRVRPTTTIHCAGIVPKTPEDYLVWHPDNHRMLLLLILMAPSPGRVVCASSQVAALQSSPYAIEKANAEHLLRPGDTCLRLPGLFGLPRRAGVIYEACLSGSIPASFGPHQAMHVEDAADYCVRAALRETLPNREPARVTYGDARLVACYGAVPWTFEARVQQLMQQVQEARRVDA
jgi:nucleoside-diphosphate-sugar epimerase